MTYEEERSLVWKIFLGLLAVLCIVHAAESIVRKNMHEQVQREHEKVERQIQSQSKPVKQSQLKKPDNFPKFVYVAPAAY
jgi:cell division protein FtsL